MESNSTIRRVLIDAFSVREPDHSRPFVEELAETLRRAGDENLAAALVDFAGADPDRQAALARTIGQAARSLAPDDEPPREKAASEAWQVLLCAADRLYGSGVHPLGRLPFISERLLRALVGEARRQQPESTGRRTTAPAGDILAGLAVSRQLREAVGRALGLSVVPTYEALYEYDPPGSHVRNHTDAGDFELTFHLLAEHTKADGQVGESVLIAHRPGESQPARISVSRGDGVVLRGRGTIHSWKAMGEGERRILTAIGFKRGN
jgi:hypothetical protein